MRILIAEDDITSRTILEVMLKKWGHEVVSTSDGNEAWKVLQTEDAPRLAILDWMMPGLDGTEICRRIRETEHREEGEQYQYIILLTGKTGSENLVTGLDAGADDYVVKPFHNSELLARIRAGQRIIELQAELLVAQEELRRQSRTDVLTGLLNRRAITQCAETEMARAKRRKTPLTLAILDIDFFKKVNDSFGHLAGDMVLKDCARCIESNMRIYDKSGRFGGEEFLIVLSETDRAGGYIVSERLRRAIEAHILVYEGASIGVTASLGVAEWDRLRSLDQWIAQADKALYKAKSESRNKVVLA